MARQQMELEMKARDDIQRRRKMEQAETDLAEKAQQNDVDLENIKVNRYPLWFP